MLGNVHRSWLYLCSILAFIRKSVISGCRF
nr:MAG TPA: hypothetical protein [Herelleviridae sp.]